jgi:hypothetical protein
MGLPGRAALFVQRRFIPAFHLAYSERRKACHPAHKAQAGGQLQGLFFKAALAAAQRPRPDAEIRGEMGKLIEL